MTAIIRCDPISIMQIGLHEKPFWGPRHSVLETITRVKAVDSALTQSSVGNSVPAPHITVRDSSGGYTPTTPIVVSNPVSIAEVGLIP